MPAPEAGGHCGCVEVLYTLCLGRALFCSLGFGKLRTLKKAINGLGPWSRSQWNKKRYIQVPPLTGPAASLKDLTEDSANLDW